MGSIVASVGIFVCGVSDAYCHLLLYGSPPNTYKILPVMVLAIFCSFLPLEMVESYVLRVQ